MQAVLLVCSASLVLQDAESVSQDGAHTAALVRAAPQSSSMILCVHM